MQTHKRSKIAAADPNFFKRGIEEKKGDGIEVKIKFWKNFLFIHVISYTIINLNICYITGSLFFFLFLLFLPCFMTFFFFYNFEIKKKEGL